MPRTVATYRPTFRRVAISKRSRMSLAGNDRDKCGRMLCRFMHAVRDAQPYAVILKRQIDTIVLSRRTYEHLRLTGFRFLTLLLPSSPTLFGFFCKSRHGIRVAQ